MATKIKYPTPEQCKQRMSELAACREQLYRQQKTIQEQIKAIENEYQACGKIINMQEKEEKQDEKKSDSRAH